LELDVLGALVADVLDDDAALELEELLLELPHALSMSAATANVSDNAFSLNIKPLLVSSWPGTVSEYQAS
jgi:hypothetical protein